MREDYSLVQMRLQNEKLLAKSNEATLEEIFTEKKRLEQELEELKKQPQKELRRNHYSWFSIS